MSETEYELPLTQDMVMTRFTREQDGHLLVVLGENHADRLYYIRLGLGRCERAVRGVLHKTRCAAVYTADGGRHDDVHYVGYAKGGREASLVFFDEDGEMLRQTHEIREVSYVDAPSA